MEEKTMQNNNPLISVIIPVYNVEKHLQRCIDSVINQTYKNLEVILVDDGSPDNCPKICDENAKKDSRIKVIHKPNGGLSSARNAGLEIAQGDYISFIDSDDWIENDLYENIGKAIKEKDFDILMFGMIIDKQDGSTETKQYNKTEKKFEIIEKDKFLEQFCILRENLEYWGELHSVCNKIYNRALLKNEIVFDTSIILEDYPFNLDCFDKANSLCILNKSFYHYSMENQDSITRQKKESQEKILRKIKAHIKKIQKTYNFCKKYKLPTKILIPFAKHEILADINKFQNGLVDIQHSKILKQYSKFILFKMIFQSINLQEALKLLFIKLHLSSLLVRILKILHCPSHKKRIWRGGVQPTSIL